MNRETQAKNSLSFTTAGPARLLGSLVLGGAFLWMSGCHEVRQLATGKTAVQVGVARLDWSAPPFMLPRRTQFFREMSKHLDEPVAATLMKPRQIRVHLAMEDDRMKLAVLSPGDYAEISRDEPPRMLAVPINSHGQTFRRGLIIVGKESPIQDLSELKAQRFHFMPNENPLNDAALGFLIANGIPREEIDEGFLGLDTHHINSLEVAKSVVLENAAAGVIDEADYESWPESGGSFLLLQPSKAQVRVLGKTVKVCEGPIVASKYASPEFVAKVEEFLFEKLNQKGVFERAPYILAILGCQGFAKPVAPEEYEPFSKIYRELYPDPIYDQPESAPFEAVETEAATPPQPNMQP